MRAKGYFVQPHDVRRKLAFALALAALRPLVLAMYCNERENGMELVHGGDWRGYRARFGHDALDFRQCQPQAGLPQGVADAIVAALPIVRTAI